MLSAYLVRLVEQHADSLTDELVADLTSNHHTPAFQNLAHDELRHLAYSVYHDLGNWLANTNDPAVHAKFEALGRERYHERVPLSETIYSISLMKKHLRDKIRAVGNVYSALELHNELHLSMMIERFFDRMVYAAAKGYEQAHQETEHPPKRATESKTPFERTPAKLEWVP